MVTRQDEFDYNRIHPNIKPIRYTPWRSYDYAGKDNDVVFEYGIPPSNQKGSKQDRDSKWKECMEQPTKEEFFEKCKEICARDLVIAFNSISAFADWHYRDPSIPYEAPDITAFEEETPDILRWAMDNLGYNPQKGGSLEFHKMGPNTTPPLDTQRTGSGRYDS